MADRYQRYIHERAKKQREDARRENRQEATKQFLQTAATVGGVAAGVYAYKSGKLDDLIRKGAQKAGLDDIVRSGKKISILNEAYHTAMRKTTGGHAWSRFNLDEKKFSSQLEKQLKAARPKLDNAMSGYVSPAQRTVQQWYGEVAPGIRQQFAKEKTREAIFGNIDNDKAIPKDIADLLAQRAKQDSDFFRAMPENVTEFLKRNNPNMDPAHLDTIGAAINRHLRTGREQFDNLLDSKEANDAVKAAQKTFLKEMNANYTKAKGTTFVDGILQKAGYRKATVDDLLAHNTAIDAGEAALGQHFGQFMQDMQDAGYDAKKLFLGNDIMVGGDGKLLDARYLTEKTRGFTNFLATNFQVPFVNLNPLRLTQTVMRNSIRDADDLAVFKKGDISPGVSVTNAFEEEVVYMFGKIFNLKGDQMFGGQEFFLAPSKHGSIQRMTADMLSVGEQVKGSALQEFLDIGLRGEESQIQRKFSVISKKWNQSYAPNILKRMRDGGTYDDAESLYRQLTSQLYRNTQTLDNDTARKVFNLFQDNDASGVLKRMGITAEDFEMDTSDEIMSTLEKVISSPDLALVKSDRFAQLKRESDLYKKDPKRYMETLFSTTTDNEFVFPGYLDSLTPNRSEMLPRTEQVKRLIQQEFVENVSINGGFMDDLDRQFSARGSESIKEMLTLNRLMKDIDVAKMKRYREGGVSNAAMEQARQDVLDEFVEGIAGRDPNSPYRYVTDIVKQKYPWWSYGPGKELPKPFEDQRYIPIRKASSFYKQELKNINEDATMDKVGAYVSTTFKTLFAGRNSAENVTSATFYPYYSVHRLNEALNTMGLGLSHKSTGSAGDIFGNLLLRRVGAAVLGLNILSYLDYEFENATGTPLSSKLADTYANMTLDVAKVRDVIGITKFNKMAKGLFPGSDMLMENPVGMALNFGTFGLIGNDRTYEEQQDFLQNGEVPIRSGRWWSFSSNSSVGGQNIKYWVPNAYRRIKSDWEYADETYGSRDEYWAHNPMPTLRHPFSTVKWLLDPSYWQRRHMDDRPYPIMGGSPIEQIPLIGPAWQSTVGRILTPTWRRSDFKDQERSYLRALNESITQQYEGSGNAVYVTGSGMGSIVNMPMGDLTESDARIATSDSVDVYGVGEYAMGGGGAIPATAGQAYKADLAAQNRATVARTSLGIAQRVSIDSLRDVNNITNLMSAQDPSAVGANLNEFYYSLTELAGIYGWATTMAFGQDYSAPRLAEASQMDTLSSRFWNANLGGLGGDISEIGRRFMPRNRYKNTYNPIANSLPSWLPFEMQYGDQFSKLENGAIRLPGEAWERMNTLHPDMFGRYGAFDRFKILADVSPYSNEFKYYNKVLSVYNANGVLSEDEKDEIDTIRKQVSERKLKYRFTPYRFKYADIEKKKVRITQMVDATTFFVEGYNNPIRLSGVKMPAMANVEGDAPDARNYISQVLKPGMDITIGLETDPLARERDDVMKTLRAVAYTGSGENINRRLSQFSSVKTDKDDNTATGAIGLYDDSAILGGLWERFAHLNTPLHTLLLQNQSPLESYKRRQVYGKDFRTWDNPWRSYVVPLVDSMGEMNPLVGTLAGALVGSLFGTKSSTGGRRIATKLGAIIGGSAATFNTMRNLPELIGGDTWVPDRRQKQREIEEYFDMLKYVKYERLYKRAATMAKHIDGVDINQIVKEGEEGKGVIAKLRKRKLESQKEALKYELSDGRSDQEGIKLALKSINAELASIDGQREVYPLGKMSILALQYKSQMDSTLYGMDSHAGVQGLFAAVPKPERPYLAQFLTASPAEREEILRLVPKNERRFFQAMWGLKEDKKTSAAEYFASHNLPGPLWEGWKPDVTLESIKIKVIQQNRLDPSDFGYYPEDISASAGAPSVGMKGFGSLEYATKELPSIFMKLLDGVGITDVQIKSQLVPAHIYGDPMADIKFNLQNDKTQEYADYLNGVSR